MDALELMLSRESALKLEAPAPSADELDQMFASAVRAPDHGRLRPWRFVLIKEDQRAAFGALLADSLRRRKPSVSDAELQWERDKAFRSPVIVAVAAKVLRGHKIPEIEQIASASAAAQTIMLAAPGRFSVTTLRPHISVRPLATARLRMSAEPPAGPATGGAAGS